MSAIAHRAICLAAVALSLAAGRSTEGAAQPVQASRIGERLAAVTGAPLVAGNELTPIENGAVFDAMVKDIASARRSVHVVTYIWRGERGPSRRITDALVRRARGVECRIVVDSSPPPRSACG